MSFYEDKTVEKEEDGKIVSVKILGLKENIPTMEMEKLAKIFDAVGYYKAADVIKGKLSGLFS